MRRLVKILIPALLLVAIVVSCAIMFASAEELPVVYVAANGTGDGSTPETPIGTDFVDYNPGHTDNAIAKVTSQKNALYRAVDKIKATGGTVVLVGEVVIDTATSRNGFGKTPGEIAWPAVSGPITITSTYGGKDYAAINGAKLLIDHTISASTNVLFSSATTIENIHIEYKYNPDKLSNYGNGFIFGARTKGLTIGEGVKVTSFNAKINAAGDKFPELYASDRYNNNTGDLKLVVKSGTWSAVGANTYGQMSNYGKLTGNSTVIIEGGTIGTVYPVAPKDNASISGDVTINITGGKINSIAGVNADGIGGKLNINIKAPAEVGTIAPGTSAAAEKNVTYEEGTVDFISDADKFTKVDPPFDPNAEKVIYISANGTGNGKTAVSPMGNAAGHDEKVAKLYEALAKYGGYSKFSSKATAEEKALPKEIVAGNALYRAFEALSATGGRIVIVGDVAIDMVSSRMPYKRGEKQSPSEFTLPACAGTVTVTSVHGDKDYRSQAKLIFDLDKCNSTFFELSSAVTFEKLNIEHKYNSGDLSGWGVPFAIAADCKTLVIGDEVNVTSFDTAKNAAGDMFPIIVGGDRYSNRTSGNTNVTINSGTWDAVYAGGYGMDATNNGSVKTATLTVNGGKIGKVFGAGSDGRAYGTASGAITITVNGGEIEKLYATNKVEYLGTGSVVTLGKDAKVTFADYTVSGYAGDLADLKTRITFVNNTDLVIGQEPPREPDVVYISANGTGDGSSPDKPLGNKTGYTVASDSYLDSAFYKAFGLLKEYGGYIVIVGDVAVDSAESRVEGKNQSPSELTLPELGGEVIITSVYNGVDYRSNAKLILDQDASAVTYLTFVSAVTFENLNIEHRYDPDDKNGWGTPMTIAAKGNKLVIGENVNVTSWNVPKNVKGNWYPAIVGGHRYLNIVGNTNVTIKSGTWSAVYAGSFGMTAPTATSDSNSGKITGNATLNIEGGRIESIYGTTSDTRKTGSITGKLTINITGGYVEGLNAIQSNGAKNQIVVNIAATAERVVKAWGGPSGAYIPENATINYDRSVIRDDEVRFWTNANATGKVEDQPDPVYYTLYVSNVEKGLGDGSSPENAIGHAEGYAELRAQALAIIKANGGTNSGITDAQKAITDAVYKKNALYRALNYNNGKLVKQGGVLVICDVLTVDATDAMRSSSLADFWGPSGSGTVTITSLHDGVDYRQKGARLVLDTSAVDLCVEFDSPVVMDHLVIEHRYNSKNGKSVDAGALIAARGNKFEIGYDVYVYANDINPDEDARVDMYPSICGGHRYSDSKSNAHVTVCSGQWAMVVGGDWGSAHTGNATIGIDGSAKIGTVCGTTKATNSNSKHVFNGSAWIGLWGGEVDNVYVVAKPGMIWGDASVGLGGTKINGKVRATHPDYEGDEIQSWIFNYTDKQIDKQKVVGFEEPVPATGSALPYLMVVATVSLVGAAAIVVYKKKKAVRG